MGGGGGGGGRGANREFAMMDITYNPGEIYLDAQRARTKYFSSCSPLVQFMPPFPPTNAEMKAEFQNCRSHIHIQHWGGGGGGVNQNIDNI